MTENTPDAVKIGRETAQDLMGRESFRRQIVAQGWVFAVRMAAEVGARAMQAAMAAPAGVREDYAAICKELGCIEKPGVPLRFIQEMRKNLTAASERIDWLLRSWDDATITERQELDRMRRGWGPTTPTERMLRHRDLRDCMQALSGALTDLTTPEDESADPEVEARLQEVYDRVNRRYLASLEILRRLDDPLVRPDLEPAGAREGAEECPYPINGKPLGTLASACVAAGECGCVHGVTRTPAGAGDLVERARNAERNITGRLRDAGWAPTRAGIESARNHIRDLADTIAALQAEVERLALVKTEMHAAAMDATARATSAEAERDALKAEVERKDKALREAGEAIAEYFRYLHGGETRGSYDGKPEREGLRKAGYAVSRALADKGEAE